MAENQLRKNEIVSLLTRSPHGKLEEYTPIGKQAAVEDPEFFSKLIAWNRIKGQILDSKVALPVIGVRHLVDEYEENSLAHLATLDPRNLVRAVRFNQAMGSGLYRKYRDLARRYLWAREDKWPWWERSAVQHRESMAALYGMFHVKPKKAVAGQILFDGMYPAGSVFQVIKDLSQMTATEAAGKIIGMKIPFLVAAGALGAKAKDPDLVLALIKAMSPTELVTNTKRLQKMGVKDNPALRAAFEQAMEKAGSSKANMMKTTVAADAVEDETMALKLKALQERQMETQKAKGAGVEGNWAVLADQSGSMASAIDTARLIAGFLAKMCVGEVHLVFFNTSPRYLRVTGKSYEEILEATKSITANGGTSMGCALMALVERKIDVDGIVVVSDGGENQLPWFANVYAPWAQAMGRQVPVYLYLLPGEPNAFSNNLKRANIDIQEFDLRGGTDQYALSGLVQTMRTQRYSLIDEIYGQRLLTLDKVLGPIMEMATV